MNFKISNIIKSELAIFHNEGIAIFDSIKSEVEKGSSVELDFTGIDRCSTQFLNAAVGKLYMTYTPSIVDKCLKITYGTVHNLESKINEVRTNALNYKEYDSLVASA